MTESEVVTMIDTFRAAWPETRLAEADAAQVAKVFGAYEAETVASAIADRLVADLPMPGLAELSRLLRVYAPGMALDGPRPAEKRRPTSPRISDLEEFPPPDPNISERIAKIRATIQGAT